ncbi:restriction endonuclease subunit S [Nocardiopsis sp. ARC36]
MSAKRAGSWHNLTISDIALFGSGDLISIASLSDRSSSHPVPVYGGNGVSGYTSSAMIDQPTVILGRVGQKCGVVYRNDGPAWITDNALYARQFKRPVNVQFFALALESARLNNVKNKNDLPLITQSILSDVKIAWPDSIEEQNQIAGVMTDTNKLITSLERMITKKQANKQGLIQQLLTGKTRLPGFREPWRKTTLGELATIVSGGTPKSSIPAYWDGGISWCTPTDITGEPSRFLTRTERTISQEGLDRSAAQLLPKGSLLLCTRATIGEVKIAKFPIATNQGFKSLVPHPGVSSEFLYYKISSIKHALATKGTGSTFLEVSKRDVAGMEVHIPELPEQKAISLAISDSDDEIDHINRRLAKARAIKQGMMQELLTGRTRLSGEENAA